MNREVNTTHIKKIVGNTADTTKLVNMLHKHIEMPTKPTIAKIRGFHSMINLRHFNIDDALNAMLKKQKEGHSTNFDYSYDFNVEVLQQVKEDVDKYRADDGVIPDTSDAYRDMFLQKHTPNSKVIEQRRIGRLKRQNRTRKVFLNKWYLMSSSGKLWKKD